ncbi:hypothetical protein V1525DRAFT_428087 [Lipomyces kononenkoae]|uniref:Uncharacterized protein n=1 Tax=Lipomyces kononenkoae TaxID=34357 RepID=A0ACC3SWD0_LIPKO
MNAEHSSVPGAGGAAGRAQLPRPHLLQNYNLNPPVMPHATAGSNTLQLRPPPPLLQGSHQDSNQTYVSAFAPHFEPSQGAESIIGVSPSVTSYGSTSLKQQTLATQTKRKAGRPRDSTADSIAHEVKRQNGPPIFCCNYCDATWAHYNPYRVKKHGLDCKGMPEDTRIRLAEELSLKSLEQNGHAIKRTKADNKHRQSIPDQKLVQSLFVELIATGGMPISAITNSSVQLLFQYAGPTVTLPSKQTFVQAILPSEIDNVCAKVTTILQEGGDQADSLTLSFDILTTAFNQIFVYVYATTRIGRTYCLSGHEFANHTSLADALDGVISADVERIGPPKFVAIVCPKLKCFTSAIAIVASRYPHILAVEPLDYYFDQLASDLCRYPFVDDVVKTMTLIYDYFHRYGQAESLLRVRMNEQGITDSLKPLLSHEPISIYVAAASMRQCLPALIKVATNDRQKLDKPTNRQQVCDVLSPESWAHRDFVSKLDSTIVIFRPLSEASIRLNASTATLADVFIAWVALVVYYHDIFQSSSLGPSPTTTTAAATGAMPYIVPELRRHIVVQTNLRFSQQFNTLPRAASSLTLAMFLHPTMALHDVLIKSPDQRSRVVHELYAQMSNLPDRACPPQQSQSQNAILYDDLAKFRHRVDIYDQQSIGGSPQRYWADVRAAAIRTFCSPGSILPGIAKRLFDINGSNMRHARVRETLDWMDRIVRDNMSTDLILGLAQCRHFYMVERANEAESHSSTGPSGEASSDDGADGDLGAAAPVGLPGGASGIDRHDIESDAAEVAYIRDPRTRLVHMYEDDSPQIDESAQSGVIPGNVEYGLPGPSQMYAAAAGPQSASPPSLAGMVDGTGSTAPGSSGALTANLGSAPQDSVFEVEKYVLLDNFRRTGYCFETSNVITNPSLTNMSSSQFPPMPQHAQSYSMAPYPSQPQNIYAPVPLPQSYNSTQPGRQFPSQYNNDISTLLSRESATSLPQQQQQQQPPPQPYSPSGASRAIYQATSYFAPSSVPPLAPPVRAAESLAPTSTNRPAPPAITVGHNGSIAPSQYVQQRGPPSADMQRFPDGFDL